MGVGHLAVGFASKRFAPRANLAWLMMAPMFIDLLWGIFILTGVEQARITPGITRAMPLDLIDIHISHSLVAVIGWALLLAAIYFWRRRDLTASWVLFSGVISHWVLDWVSHRPDLQITFHGPKYGLALWNYPLAAFSVEAALLMAGAFLYVSCTRPRSPRGKISLAILLIVLFAFNAASYFGPPAGDIRLMAATNLSVLILLWACWRIDRAREPAST
jgi:hypothetical protein